MNLDFFCLHDDSLNNAEKQLSYLEQSFTYPFGNDSFTIDHGQNYFDFFKLLGDVFCFGYKADKKIVISVICVLRNINNELIWYIADLKVYKKIANFNLLAKLKQDIFTFLYNKANKFYAINMNAMQQQHGRIAKVLNRNLPIAIEYAHDLAIYLVDMPTFIFCINNLFTGYELVSLQGKKDLILKSTNARLPLVHVKLKDSASRITINNQHLQPNNKFMFSTLMHSSLQQQLAHNNILPIATAAIINSGMENYNWQFINTCEL